MADLPESARVFAEVIGFESTLKLAGKAQYGAVCVPKHINEKHWIAQCIGYARAQALARAFGGAVMPLAACKQVAVVVRQRKTVEAYRQGTPPVVIADLLGVSLRTVLRDLDDYGSRAEPSPLASASPTPELVPSPPPGMRGRQTTPASR